jgi:hypothetical protein
MIGRHGPTERTGADIVTVTAQPNGDARRRAAEDASIGDLISDVEKNLAVLLQREIELAKLELRVSVKHARTGTAFFGLALALIAFSTPFGFIALAEGIHAAGLWRWLSYLAVFLFMVLVAGLFGFLGIKKVKRIRAPKRTMSTSMDTVAHLKTIAKRG